MERRLRQRYGDMAAGCGDIESSLEGEEVDWMVKGMAMFKYLGINLDQTADDWPVVSLNIMCIRSVWGRLGTLLRKEGVEPRV